MKSDRSRLVHSGVLPEDINASAFMGDLSRQWGIPFTGWRDDLPMAGSPERSTWRRVVESRDRRLYVLERIHSSACENKHRIIKNLDALFDRGLRRIVPYLPDIYGDPLPLVRHGLWQLCPYVGGVVLDRPAYVMDDWRGDVTAEFLIHLYEVSSRAPMPVASPPLSLHTYIEDLFALLERRSPDVANHFRPFVGHLRQHLFPILDRLPRRFCHGDVHPLNIIWGKRSIRAVIDWEFCGVKPEIYDLANLLGCLGIEDPQSLTGPFVRRLVEKLSEFSVYARSSWQVLPEMILAVRFGWLSEWLRKRDWPMIRMEADFMALLVDYRPDLKALWTAGTPER